MICCLCLKKSEDTTKIFEGNEDQENHIATIVAKHFWFEPLKNDPVLAAICKICWARLCDFHEFYEMVEVAHQRYHKPDGVIVKTEAALFDCSYLPSKHEPDDFVDLGEVPISTELVTINKTSSKSLVSEEAHPNFAHNRNDDQFQAFQYKSELSDPFDDTDVAVATNESPVKEESLDLLVELNAETRPSTNSRKVKRTAKTREEKFVETQTAIKRGRKRNEESKPVSKSPEPEHKPKKQRGKNKANKKPEEESAYKIKMKSFDKEISQYMGLHCDVCNIAADDFAGIKSHMRSEHNIDNGYVKCCDKKFHKRANLLHHIRHHVDPNCYRCEECDQTFSDYQTLRTHNFIKHQKEEDKIYECTECTKKFAKKYLLEQHRTFKHKDRFKQCKTCNRRYKTLEELEEHNKEPCVGGRMCDICAKVIFGPGAFKRHQLEHEGGQPHKVQCDMCGSWHTDKHALRKHKRRHLEPKTPHVCDICHKVSPSREAMVSHKKRAHRSDRTFKCEFCQKCFKRPISLREHITTHTGAVLYTCPHCPKTFNSNANMHSHRKNVHPVEFEEARKRRQRVGYLGDQLPMSESSKSKINTFKTDNENEVSDLSKIRLISTLSKEEQYVPKIFHRYNF